MEEITFVIITISNSCYKNAAIDESGPILQNLIKDNYTNCSIQTELIPDKKNKIKKCLLSYCECEEYLDKVKIIFTIGGTQFTTRNISPETISEFIECEYPQLNSAIENFKKTPYATLSRAFCDINKQSLIINLPGSIKPIKECFESMKLLLPDIVRLMSNKIELIQKNDNINTVDEHICPYKINSDDHITDYCNMSYNQGYIDNKTLTKDSDDIHKLITKYCGIADPNDKKHIKKLFRFHPTKNKLQSVSVITAYVPDPNKKTFNIDDVVIIKELSCDNYRQIDRILEYAKEVEKTKIYNGQILIKVDDSDNEY